MKKTDYKIGFILCIYALILGFMVFSNINVYWKGIILVCGFMACIYVVTIIFEKQNL